MQEEFLLMYGAIFNLAAVKHCVVFDFKSINYISFERDYQRLENANPQADVLLRHPDWNDGKAYLAHVMNASRITEETEYGCVLEQLKSCPLPRPEHDLECLRDVAQPACLRRFKADNLLPNWVKGIIYVSQYLNISDLVMDKQVDKHWKLISWNVCDEKAVRMIIRLVQKERFALRLHVPMDGGRRIESKPYNTYASFDQALEAVKTSLTYDMYEHDFVYEPEGFYKLPRIPNFWVNCFLRLPFWIVDFFLNPEAPGGLVNMLTHQLMLILLARLILYRSLAYAYNRLERLEQWNQRMYHRLHMDE